jgi:hypothetical protein
MKNIIRIAVSKSPFRKDDSCGRSERQVGKGSLLRKRKACKPLKESRDCDLFHASFHLTLFSSALPAFSIS